tara:strand:- start:37 stop:537 length:501 start_codon:yes stop_codon:yes gene_type:complete
MAHAPDHEEPMQKDIENAQRDGASDTAGAAPADDDAQTSNAAPAPASAPATTQPLSAPAAASAAPVPGNAQPGNLAEISAQLREAAAEIAEIAAQAGRLGIAIDAAKALREGTMPEALRRLVLERASAAADARDVMAAAPSPILPQSKESPIVAAAKRAAATGARG